MNMTNAEWIKSMNNKELAEFLMTCISWETSCMCIDGVDCYDYADAEKWLEKECD